MSLASFLSGVGVLDVWYLILCNNKDVDVESHMSISMCLWNDQLKEVLFQELLNKPIWAKGKTYVQITSEQRSWWD